MAISCVQLALVIVPVASRGMKVPDPGGRYGSFRVRPVQGPGLRVVAGGMAGWQITLIAVGAAVLAAALAIRLDRTLASRGPGLTITFWPARSPREERPPGARRPARRSAAGVAGRIAGDRDAPAPAALGAADIVEFGRDLTR